VERVIVFSGDVYTDAGPPPERRLRELRRERRRKVIVFSKGNLK
jgi:hypothetical protein